MIFSLPINTMCLKRISAVRAEDDRSSAGLEDADHFADRGAVILFVFEHLLAEDQVEGPGWKRKGFPCGVDNMRGVLSGFGGSLEVIFQANDFSTKWGEVFDVHSHAATVFQDAPFDAFPRGPGDRARAPRGAPAPDQKARAAGVASF